MSQLRELTQLDLDLYLGNIQKRIDHYKAEDFVKPDEYNKEQIRLLIAMADQAIARFHNQ